MATQNAFKDKAVAQSILSADGETDTETRRIHTRTRGSVNALSMELVNSSGSIIDFTKSIKTVTGTVAADTDIVGAVTGKRIKVIAYSIVSASTSLNTITFQSNASTALWTVPLQAISGTLFGANLAVSAPSFLFGTVAGEKLTLDVSAAVNVTYSIAYYDDDAT